MRSTSRLRTMGGVVLATLVGTALVACQPPDGRDLSVVVVAPPTTLAGGEAAGFDVEVANVGDAAATGARLTLLVPLGIDASATVDGVDCVAEGVLPEHDAHAVGCALGDVEPEGGRTVRVEVVGDVAGATGTITASGSSTGGGEPKKDGAVHVVSVPISVTPLDRIDLEVIPAALATPPPVGAAFASRAEVVNRGTIPAGPVTVTQTFASTIGVAAPTLVRGDGATGTCSVAGQVATCTTGGLTVDPLVDADDRWEMVVQATPQNGSHREITYAATAPQPEPSPDPSPNTATSSFWAGGSWLIVDAPSDVAVGATFQVPITWFGGGFGQYVQATIPASLRLDALTVPNFGSIPCSGTGSVRCSAIGPFIGDGGSILATFTATDVDGPASIAFFINSEAGSASGSARVEVVDPTISSDVHARFAPTPFALIGAPVTIAGEVRTAGPTTHADVVATITAPPGSVVHRATWGPLDLPCSLTGRVATCAVGDLAGHEQVPFEMVLTSYASGPATAVVDVASATAQDDPDPHPDQDQLTFPVRGPFVDLGASVEVANTTPLQGTTFDAVVRATNHGSESASDVVLEATIPSGWSLSSYGLANGSSSGSCTGLGGGRYRCTFPTVAAGRSGALRLTIWAGPAGAVDLVATVAGADADPVPDERPNEARTTVDPVGAHADLELTLTGPNPLVLGETRSVGTTVRNLGPSQVPQAEVVIEIPAGWAIGTPTSGGGSCSTTLRTVTCTTGSITSGSTRSVSVPVTPSEVRSDVVTATVTSTLPDPNPTSDSAQATISAVAPQVDLGINEPSDSWFTFPSGGTFNGRSLTFTNHGNVAATDVVITGTLSPVGTITDVRQSGIPVTATCDWSGPSFTCTLPAVPAGSTRTLQFAASIPATSGPLQFDVAISSASSESPAGQPNQRTVTMIASSQPVGIDGTVVGPGGAPVAGAVVRIYAPADGFAPTRRVDTGADGTWQARGLAPGTYRISVTPPAGSGLAAEWYQDRPDRTSAHPLVVATSTPYHVIVVQLS